jgi:hypothetical protein
MSRHSYKPTDEQRQLVERLVGLLVTETEIVRDFIRPPLSMNTFKKHFKDEIAHGRARTASRIKAMIFQHAARGNVRCLLYLADRLTNLGELAPREAETPGNTTIIIRGGLPQTIEGNALVKHEPEGE